MATQGILKADRLHAGFDDVRPVGKSVDHGPAETGIAEVFILPPFWNASYAERVGHSRAVK